MKFFLDCEFNGFNGELISMALVPEMGEPFYEVLDTSEMDLEQWVKDNVMPIIVYHHKGSYTLSPTQFRAALASYLNRQNKKEITIVADWPDDIKHFCQALITGPGTMSGLHMNLNFEIRRCEYVSEVPHNALSDAYGIRNALMTPKDGTELIRELYRNFPDDDIQPTALGKMYNDWVSYNSMTVAPIPFAEYVKLQKR